MAGGCMAGTSSSIKPRARGLRQHSEYFMKFFCSCPVVGRAGLLTGRVEQPHLPACAHVQPLHHGQDLSTCTHIPTAAETHTHTSSPCAQRCPCLGVPQPSTIGHKPPHCSHADTASACTQWPQTWPHPHSAPRAPARSSPALQPGKRPLWCRNPLVPSQLSLMPLTLSSEVPLSRARQR